jgi:signal transduction histidine kinase
MSRNAKRLGLLINDMLDISGLGARSFKISPRRFDAAKTIRELAQDIEPVLVEKAQKLDLRMPEGGLFVNADSDRFEQVVTNLLTNASKYSGHGTTVELTASWTDRELAVAVADRGFGISKEDQAKLFEPFYRVDNESTRSVPGTGLGLYITKSIVEMHHGVIRLDSEPGQGTTVTVTLPCVVPQSGIPEAEPEAVTTRSRLYPEIEQEDIPAAA